MVDPFEEENMRRRIDFELVGDTPDVVEGDKGCLGLDKLDTAPYQQMLDEREIVTASDIRVDFHDPFRYEINGIGDRLAVGGPDSFDPVYVGAGADIEPLDIIGKDWFAIHRHAGCSRREAE